MRIPPRPSSHSLHFLHPVFPLFLPPPPILPVLCTPLSSPTLFLPLFAHSTPLPPKRRDRRRGDRTNSTLPPPQRGERGGSSHPTSPRRRLASARTHGVGFRSTAQEGDRQKNRKEVRRASRTAFSPAHPTPKSSPGGGDGLVRHCPPLPLRVSPFPQPLLAAPVSGGICEY